MLKAIKKSLDKFLKKLANENQKTFGNERLDCCNLDRDKSPKK